jgi:hypothetical protein
MNKEEEKKCCRDCVHCVIHFYEDVAKYDCGLTETEDRVSGELNYKSCYEIIDTDKCNFKMSYIKLVVGVLSIVAVVGIFIFQLFNLMGE